MCLTKAEGGRGFKNLYAHSLAMLAKQGWRLVSNPSSLFARLLKARYHPNGSFWEAELGEFPSFSWRSILSARPILDSGIQWKVGTGLNINIWKDNWIPNTPSYMLHKLVGCDIEQVVELIDSSSRSWIPQVLHTIFPPVFVEKILCIHLNRYLMLDKLTWKLEKKGFFLVKSAYWIARDIVLDNIAASSSLGDPYNLLWKALWNSKIPGKV